MQQKKEALRKKTAPRVPTTPGSPGKNPANASQIFRKSRDSAGFQICDPGGMAFPEVRQFCLAQKREARKKQ